MAGKVFVIRFSYYKYFRWLTFLTVTFQVKKDLESLIFKYPGKKQGSTQAN